MSEITAGLVSGCSCRLKSPSLSDLWADAAGLYTPSPGEEKETRRRRSSCRGVERKRGR